MAVQPTTNAGGDAKIVKVGQTENGQDGSSSSKKADKPGPTDMNISTQSPR